MLIDAAIRAVEWAHNSPRSSCYACFEARRWGGGTTGKLSISTIHAKSCPIPALGAAILRENHWYTREWAELRGKTVTAPEMKHPCGLVYRPSVCMRPLGHDSGIHEPTPEELA